LSSARRLVVKPAVRVQARARVRKFFMRVISRKRCF
jgi:hypothetical protein